MIHVEQVFANNVFTARGNAVHALVDEPGYELRRGVRAERSLPLWSDRFGLIGKADLVEFHPDDSVFPVEIKHGPNRKHTHDDIQLAVQALCLVEMLGKPDTCDAIYPASSRRRRKVDNDASLRNLVVATTRA